MRIIISSDRKVQKHIAYCEYELQHLKRWGRHYRDKKPHYFRKQIEVAKKKLKSGR